MCNVQPLLRFCFLSLSLSLLSACDWSAGQVFHVRRQGREGEYLAGGMGGGLSWVWPCTYLTYLIVTVNQCFDEDIFTVFPGLGLAPDIFALQKVLNTWNRKTPRTTDSSNLWPETRMIYIYIYIY